MDISWLVSVVVACVLYGYFALENHKLRSDIREIRKVADGAEAEAVAAQDRIRGVVQMQNDFEARLSH
jgi:predicted PurR-regulated permease PerM